LTRLAIYNVEATGMAYEVTKIVKGHRYRYRVESVRDIKTGRSRARWTYLGRVGDDDVVVPRRRSPNGNVDRIIGAIVKLLERRRIEHVTMTVIAREAGVAPGTIYRHFRSRREAILAAVQFVNDGVLAQAGTLSGPVTTREQERERLHEWIRSVLAGGIGSPALMQAVPAMLESSGDAPDDGRRPSAMRDLLRDYLGRLAAAGMVTEAMTARLSSAIFVAMEGVFRVALSERERFSKQLIDDAAYLIDRAVFGPA
jgi:AcrR family transcriptional regulator